MTTRMACLATTAATLALLGLAPPVSAQQKLDEKRSASPDGSVEIENAAGSIRVLGWSRPEVTVTGTLGAGAEGLDLSGGSKRTRIEVEAEGNPHRVISDLEIHVPTGSRVEINSFSANISVSDVTGAVTAETVSGSISVSGPAREVSAHTVQGAIDIDGAIPSLQIEAVNGSVTVKGARGAVEANTVNGRLSVAGSAFDRVELEAVSGPIFFDGSLRGDADLSAQSVSGTVELALPASVSAEVSLSTFSGDVQSDFGQVASPRGRHGRHAESEFTLGGGDARISVETLSGTITLRRK
jgi:DUF4097 and DUF4098 domain-containing protein YvlB